MRCIEQMGYNIFLPIKIHHLKCALIDWVWCVDAFVGLIDWVRCVEQMGNNIVFPNQNPTFEVCTDRLGAVRRTKNVAFIGLIDWMRCVEQMGNNIFFTNQNPIFLFCADWTAVECTLHMRFGCLDPRLIFLEQCKI